MKLKEFNPENSRSTRAVMPNATSVTLHSKSGLITLNAAACGLLSLKAGDQVKVFQDDEDRENWYIEKVASGGFTLRQCKDTTALRFGSKKIVLEIFKSVGYGQSTGRCLIAGQPTPLGHRKLYGILTIGLRNL